MTKPFTACCTSPAALCYWFVVSLIAWGGLALAGLYWRPLRASSAATILLAMAVGCFANWFRNRTFHCAITGPLFLLLGLASLLMELRVIQLDSRWIWPVVLLGAGVAYLLEWRYARRSSQG